MIIVPERMRSSRRYQLWQGPWKGQGRASTPAARVSGSLWAREATGSSWEQPAAFEWQSPAATVSGSGCGKPWRVCRSVCCAW